MASAPPNGVARPRFNSASFPAYTPLPALVYFNRLHHAVMLKRYISCLGADLRGCSNAGAQVKLLLREQLLMWLFRAEVASLSSSPSRTTEEADRPHKQASIGDLLPVVREVFEQRAMESQQKVSDLARKKSASSVNLAQSYKTSKLRRHHSGMITSTRSSDCLGPRTPSITPASPHHALKHDLMNFVPITCRLAGFARNRFCYHRYVDGIDPDPDVSVWLRYEEVKALGEGHFGEVILAREKCSGIDVAIKRFELVAQGSEDEEDDCGEGHILNALAHPNLIRVYEVVETHSEVYLMMEFAPGATLTKYAGETARGGWIGSVMQQIVSAVVYCHEVGVLHGDLKPENVLIGGLRPDGAPLCLISDFGHAAMSLNGSTSTGDPRYIPPEVAEKTGVSFKSDVWMLGMSRYELLTGGWLPFYQETAAALDLECPGYESTLGWFLLNRGGNVIERMHAGLDYNDLQRLQRCRLKHEAAEFGAPSEAVGLVKRLLSWNEADRPSALDLLQDNWITAGSASCKTAQSPLDKEFGLWSPRQSTFAESLRRRAKLPPPYRFLLAALATSVNTNLLVKGRLLFRFFDLSGKGKLTPENFINAAKQANLPLDVAQSFFKASDLYDQGYLDFKNLISMLLDVKSMSDDELVALAKSTMNRMCGPKGALDAETDAGPSVTFDQLRMDFRRPEGNQKIDAGFEKLIDQLHAQMTKACVCGNVFLPDATTCPKCGKQRPDPVMDGGEERLTSTVLIKLLRAPFF